MTWCPHSFVDQVRDVFLDELAGSTDTNFHRLFNEPGDLTSRVVFQSADFWIIPPLGPLGDAHYMILPTRSCLRFSDLSPAQRNSLRSAHDWLVSRMVARWGTPMVFEHGPSADRRIGAGRCAFMQQAHMHFVSSRLSVADVLTEVTDRLTRLGVCNRAAIVSACSPTDLPASQTSLNGYIYIAAAGREGSYLPVNGNIETQFLRRILALRLGYGPLEWDWRLFPRKTRVLELYQTLVGGEPA